MLKRLVGLFKGQASVPVVSQPVIPLAQVHSYRDLAQRQIKPVLSGDELLALLQLQSRIAELRELMGLPEGDWQVCCLDAIRHFAEAVQLAPASEVHHHAFCGGLLVHTLDAAVIALKIRRKFSLPAGAGAERVNEAATRWTYGVFCSILLHDPGKVGAGVSLLAKTPNAVVRWSPLNGSMRRHGIREYQLSFEKAPYKLHTQVGQALFTEIIPETGRRWISADQELLQQLLCAVGDVHGPGSGVLGEILVQADGQSVAKDLGQPKSAVSQTTGATSIALVDKYMRSLRGLVTTGKLTLNKPGAQVFVTRKKHAPDAASDVWVLCRAAAEAIVKDLRAGDATVPSEPARVYDVLQEHGMCVATPSGKAIWNTMVHAGSWSSEFSVLRFEAFRIWGPGKVPPAFAGSVKVIKAGAAVKQKPSSGAVVSQRASGPAANFEDTTGPEEFSTFDSDPGDYQDESGRWHSAGSAEQQEFTAPEGTLGPEENSILTSAPELSAQASAQESLLMQQLCGPIKKPKAGSAKASTSAPTKLAPAPAVKTSSLTTAPEATAQVPARAASKPAAASAAITAPTGASGIALSEAFFAYVKSLLDQDGSDLNCPTAMLHVHEDGLLLVTPKIFKAFAGDDWIALQTAVTASGYVLCVQRRHVLEYMIRDPQGKVSKSTLRCAVIVPSACKVLFNALPPCNQAILGRK